jgi:hypothetical protein
MTILESIKAELAELRAKFTAQAPAPEPKATETTPEPKAGESTPEPKAEENTPAAGEATPEPNADLIARLAQAEASVAGIDIEAIKTEAKETAKAELKAEVSAELEKEFEAKVASAAAEKIAAQGVPALATGGLTKEDKQALKGRALTVAAMKAEKTKSA